MDLADQCSACTYTQHVFHKTELMGCLGELGCDEACFRDGVWFVCKVLFSDSCQYGK